MSDDVAGRMRGLADAPWVARGDAATQAALREGAAEVEIELGYTRATTAFHEVDASQRQSFTPKRGARGRRDDRIDPRASIVRERTPGPVSAGDDVLDRYGAGDGLPDVGAPEPLFDGRDDGPQWTEGAA